MAKKQSSRIIESVTSVEGKIYVWIKSASPNERSKRVEINTKLNLEQFLLKKLNLPVSTFLSSWN